jgi:hypothetical protein
MGFVSHNRSSTSILSSECREIANIKFQARLFPAHDSLQV